MTETAVRDLMRQAMAADEPPIGPVLGKALRAARRARRQRLAASVAAGLVIAACVVVGAGTVFVRGNAVAAAQFVFVKPVLPDTTYTHIQPITSEYLGQLLISELPLGARHSQVLANANSNIPGATGRTASASLGEVTTSLGWGYVRAEMMAAGATDTGFGCAPGLAAGYCHVYALAGGVKVMEEYASASLTTTHRQFVSFSVQVFRPRVALVDLYESNEAGNAGGAVARDLPIKASQLLTAALDPRWQFFITKLALSSGGSGHGMLT